MAEEKVEQTTPVEGDTPSADSTTQADATIEQEADVNGADLLEVIARLESELAESRQECAEITDKSQRLAAEFQNSRRRQERQLADEVERASAHVVRRLLPVIDDFDLAFANMPGDLGGQEAWVEGFRQIQRKLRATLEDEGLAQVPAEGEFDPTLHEAISSAPSDTVPSGHIIDVMRAGYTLKGRVLRPALVRIAV